MFSLRGTMSCFIRAGTFRTRGADCYVSGFALRWRPVHESIPAPCSQPAFWALIKDNDVDLSKSSFITQGFGNAGAWASTLLGRHGTKLLATCNSRQAIFNSKGLDVDALRRHYDETRDLASFPEAESISMDQFWKIKADILIPAALESQITSKNVADIDVRVIAEAANGPTTLAADQALADRGVAIIPDILCNAGGVIVSYFEWVQNKKSEHWELSEVDTKLERLIKGAYRRVIEMQKDRGISTRTAAFAVALQRIRAAYLQRQVFP